MGGEPQTWSEVGPGPALCIWRKDWFGSVVRSWPGSGSAGSAKDRRPRVAQCHALQALCVPRGMWLCSQPTAVIFLRLLPPSSALHHSWQLSSPRAVGTQIKWQSWGFNEPKNFFILETKNLMSPVSVHCISPEMVSLICLFYAENRSSPVRREERKDWKSKTIWVAASQVAPLKSVPPRKCPSGWPGL